MDTANKPLVLGELELATLEYLWTRGSGNAKAIHAVLGLERGNTLNTIQSTLDRLYRKGLLARHKQGHSFQYSSLFSRTEVLTRKISELAIEMSGGEMQSLFAAFIEFTNRVDPSKLAELETLLAQHRKTSREEGP